MAQRPRAPLKHITLITGTTNLADACRHTARKRDLVHTIQTPGYKYISVKQCHARQCLSKPPCSKLQETSLTNQHPSTKRSISANAMPMSEYTRVKPKAIAKQTKIESPSAKDPTKDPTVLSIPQKANTTTRKRASSTASRITDARTARNTGLASAHCDAFGVFEASKFCLFLQQRPIPDLNL